MAGDERGSATIVSAVGPRQSGGDDGESWLQGSLSYALGKQRWTLELDVEVADRPPYRVSGRWRVPNRLWKLHRALDGPGRLFPGIVLPVVVSSSDPHKVEIDWDEFKRSGADSQLYPDTGAVRTALAELITDVRGGEAVPAKPRPSSPRPTADAYPPIEGVDYETWIRAWVGLIRDKVRRRDHADYYEDHGLPAGRGPAVAAAWYDRVKADDSLRSWYVYDCDSLELP